MDFYNEALFILFVFMLGAMVALSIIGMNAMQAILVLTGSAIGIVIVLLMDLTSVEIGIAVIFSLFIVFSLAVGASMVIQRRAKTTSDGNITNFKKSDKKWLVCEEDIKHHCSYMGTASNKEKGVHCPSPLVVFKTGVVPPDYLDTFPPESQWYKEIQRFKHDNNL